MQTKFYPVKLENAYLVSPWINLVQKDTPYKGLGEPKYQAKLMISNKSRGYQEILKRQEIYHELGELSKSKSFFSPLASQNDYLDEERRIWAQKEQDPSQWSIIKVTRTKGEHDLYSPKNKLLPKEPSYNKFFTRGAKVNFDGGLAICSGFPIIIIYSVQYVDKGFSEHLNPMDLTPKSPFQVIDSGDDPFDLEPGESLEISLDDDNPPF